MEETKRLEETKQLPKTVAFKWKTKEGTPSIYTNYVTASWTLFDVRFVLGQLIPDDPNAMREFVVEERATVTCAWPEAKALRDILADLVARYEKANGEIKPIILPLASTLPPNEPPESKAQNL